MEESKQSSSDDNNLDLIVRQLEELAGGFCLRVYKVLTRDFGLPQRRIRLFFLGVSKRHYPDFNMDVVTKHLEAFKLQCQSPDSFFEMLCTLFFLFRVDSFFRFP
jgi:site-specific DNA-cytosine methylase